MVNLTNNKAIKFQKAAQSGFQFRSIMLFQIPLIWFSGIKIKTLQRANCSVSLPFTRRTQNPFKSVYFAAQCMAAELSTGMLMMIETLETGKKCSMLVTSMKADFVKKADGDIVFECIPEKPIKDSLDASMQSGEPVKILLKSIGKLKDGVVVASFEFEWSVKIKE